MAPIPTITTARLRLVPLAMRHFEPFAREQADPAVTRHIRDGKPQDRTAAFATLCTMVGHWDLRGYGMWAIEEPDGTWVGRAGFIYFEGYSDPELGWQIARDRQGRGYATEAARAAMDFGFAQWKFPRLICIIQPANLPSIAVARKLGCTLEGMRAEPDGPVQVWRCPTIGDAAPA